MAATFTPNQRVVITDVFGWIHAGKHGTVIDSMNRHGQRWIEVRLDDGPVVSAEEREIEPEQTPTNH